MESAVNNAERYFIDQKYNCAEATLLALCKEWGVSSDAVPRIAAGFGGGVGKKGLICGVLSGAVMAIGLRFGSPDPTDTEKRKLVTNLVSRLLESFQDSFGETGCRELIGCDLSTPEGMMKAKVEGVRTEKCRHFVRRAAELALNICA
jgi:C_GCAxxG_C_C family probable redox protein